MTLDLIFQLGAMLLAAAATYGAIKSDLKNLHEKSKENRDSAEHAHTRIDQHVRDHLLVDRRKGEGDV